jgi:hypothetical protein
MYCNDYYESIDNKYDDDNTVRQLNLLVQIIYV